MVIFNSYFDITRGYIHGKPPPENLGISMEFPKDSKNGLILLGKSTGSHRFSQ
jgi:hypothetical protein